MEIIAYVAVSALVVTTLGSLWIVFHRTDWMREFTRMIAQTDERVKQHQRSHELLMNRFMALFTPENYASMRQLSHTIEAAPLSTKPHYLDEKMIAEELDRQRKKEEIEEKVVAGTRRGLVNGTPPGPAEPEQRVNTALGFENGRGP